MGWLTPRTGQMQCPPSPQERWQRRAGIRASTRPQSAAASDRNQSAAGRPEPFPPEWWPDRRLSLLKTPIGHWRSSSYESFQSKRATLSLYFPPRKRGLSGTRRRHATVRATLVGLASETPLVAIVCPAQKKEARALDMLGPLAPPLQSLWIQACDFLRRRAVRPASPVPRSRIVAGSGTGLVMI